MPTITVNGKDKNVSQDLYSFLLSANDQELMDWEESSSKKQKIEETLEVGNLDTSSSSLLSEGPILIFSQGVNKSERISFGSTHSNLQEITTDLSKVILLRYEVVNNKINIITNRGQRADTWIAGSQGDHVTAYVTLLQAICSIVDGEDVHEAPQILYEATKCFFGENAGQSIKMKSLEEDEYVTFEERLQQSKKLFFPRDVRKNLTKYLRIIKEHGTDLANIDNTQLRQAWQFLVNKEHDTLNVENLRDSIKRSNQVIFAQLIVELGEKVLASYNKLPTAAFPKLKIDKEGSAEGNRVKGAMKELRLFNKLVKVKISLNNIVDEIGQLELLSDFLEQCENIIKTSKPQITTIEGLNKDFKSFLKKTFGRDDAIELKNEKGYNITLLLSYFKGLSLEQINCSQIGEWFNNLFDFKQKNIILAIEDQEDGDIIDHKDGKKIVLKKPADTLYQVTGRHINFMFIAFKYLNNLSANTKKEIIEQFLKEIIASSSVGSKVHAQGWGEYFITVVDFEAPRKLNINDLIEGVKEHCILYKDVTKNRSAPKP